MKKKDSVFNILFFIGFIFIFLCLNSTRFIKNEYIALIFNIICIIIALILFNAKKINRNKDKKENEKLEISKFQKILFISAIAFSIIITISILLIIYC